MATRQKDDRLGNFVSSFKTDLSRPNRYEVKLNLRNNYLYQNEKFGTSQTSLLTLRCENAELPGRSLMTHDQKIYGPTEKFPYQTSYNDISLTFIVGGDMMEKKLFDTWLQVVSPINSWNFNYKDSYTSDITIIQLDVANREVYSVSLVDAYPISVNQLDLDWSSDGHHKLVVTFAYTYYIPIFNTVQNEQMQGFLPGNETKQIAPGNENGILPGKK